MGDGAVRGGGDGGPREAEWLNRGATGSRSPPTGPVRGVGNVNARDAFALVYYHTLRGEFYTRWVSARSGEMSAEVRARMYASVPGSVEVVDNHSPTDDTVAAVVIESGFEGFGDIQGRVLTIPATGAPQVGPRFLHVGSSTYYHYEKLGVAQTALPNHILVVYREQFVYSSMRIVYVHLVDLNGPPSQLNRVALPVRSENPDIAGDGIDFTVAYEVGSDIHCRFVDVISGSPVLGIDTLAINSGQRPSIALSGGSYTIGFERAGQSLVASIDSSTCTACEGEFRLSKGTATGHAPRMAGRAPGGRPTDDALLAWSRGTSSNGWIEIAPYRFEDGVVTDLGGGCARRRRGARQLRAVRQRPLHVRTSLRGAVVARVLRAGGGRWRFPVRPLLAGCRSERSRGRRGEHRQPRPCLPQRASAGPCQHRRREALQSVVGHDAHRRPAPEVGLSNGVQVEIQ